MKMKLLAGIAVIMLAGAVWADPIVNYSFEATGDLSITGNSVCGGPCTQNIAFTMRINIMVGPGSLDEAQPSGIVTSASGPLGSSFLASPWIDFGGNPINYPGPMFDLEFTDADGDIIFVAGYVPLTPDGLSIAATPLITETFFWDCQTAACAAEFVPPSFPPTPGDRGFDLIGTVHANVQNVPEPSSLALLIITIVAIWTTVWVKSDRLTVFSRV